MRSLTWNLRYGKISFWTYLRKGISFGLFGTHKNFSDIKFWSKLKFKSDFGNYPFFIQFLEDFDKVMKEYGYSFDFNKRDGIFVRTGMNGAIFDIFGRYPENNSVGEFLMEAIREKSFSFYIHAPNTGNHVGMGCLGYFVSYVLEGSTFVRSKSEVEWHIEKQQLIGNFPNLVVDRFIAKQQFNYGL